MAQVLALARLASHAFLVLIGAPLGLQMPLKLRVFLVETALGNYSSDQLCGWSLPDGYDEVQVASSLPDFS